MTNEYSPAWFETFGRPDEGQTAREVDVLLGVLPPPPASVLDVPCGVGRHACALAARGYRVTGVDRDPAAAAEARAGGVEVHELDLRRLDELEASFDAVICMWASFGWWDDETNARAFAALARKAGEVLVLDVYDPAFFRGRDGVRTNRGVRDVKRVVGERLLTTLSYPDGTTDEFEWRLYEPDELSSLGAACGLRLEPPTGPSGETPRALYVFRRDTRGMTWDELVEAVTTDHPELRPGSMFGMPCLKRENGKVVAGHWKDGGLTVKLTDTAAREEALALDGVELFDPGMGRVMREWVLVPAAQSAHWRRLVEDAL